MIGDCILLFHAEAGMLDSTVTVVKTFALFFSSRRRHTRLVSDWSSDVCSSDLIEPRFPAIAEALQQDGAAVADRDRFALLEPVGRLLKEIVPEGAGADALEVHVLLLHHAYQFWAAKQPVYEINDQALRRAALEPRITTQPPHPAQ